MKKFINKNNVLEKQQELLKILKDPSNNLRNVFIKKQFLTRSKGRRKKHENNKIEFI
ncbi:MAG: hypothetical protein RBQ97_10190 [Acholeplasma sp.]|nr:hypothetical protein [Acholeplasma sp.]